MKVSQFPGLAIGQRVFLTVTPSTHHLSLVRPCPERYFVLETKVIDITGDGTYRFNTSFFVRPDRLSIKLTDAKIKLSEIFHDETGTVLDYLEVQMVRHKEEVCN